MSGAGKPGTRDAGREHDGAMRDHKSDVARVLMRTLLEMFPGQNVDLSTAQLLLDRLAASDIVVIPKEHLPRDGDDG